MKDNRTIHRKDALLGRLTNPEYSAEYLNAAMEDGSPAVFLNALRNVAAAKGMSQISKSASLNRESLYRMLSKKGNPNLSSLVAILDCLGLEIAVKPKEKMPA